MFRRTLRSVVPMDPSYLAVNDGSLESAGRGSGLKKSDIAPGAQKKAIPHMQMTFAPLERRLDTAIFRSMFASSARQARQFVVHGAVTVNGKKVCCSPAAIAQTNNTRCDTQVIYSIRAICFRSTPNELCTLLVR